MKTYKQKLQSPKWQMKRLEIFQRDLFTCQRCESMENELVVHHLIYEKEFNNPWDYPPELLLTLCCDCHNYEHENQLIAIDKLGKNMLRYGLLSDDIYKLAKINYSTIKL